MSFAEKLPQAVVRRIDSMGEAGQHWASNLDQLVPALAETWELTVGDILEGGSEALVMQVETRAHEPMILKIKLPGELDHEATILRVADGVGYAELVAYDESNNAMLLEQLGAKLSDVAENSTLQIEAMVETMLAAWKPLDPKNVFNLTTGAEKALWLKDFIVEVSEHTDHPIADETLSSVLNTCEQCADEFDPALAVMVHGDVHPQNTLQAVEGFKLIDPDGLFAQKATDLATIMRDGNAELLAGQPGADLKSRAEKLARMTGEDPDRIWRWGLIERASTGLLLKQLGFDEADDYLSVLEKTVNY